MGKKPLSREDRLAAALRENLKRRKAAERARTEPAAGQETEPAAERPNTANTPD
jgi:hypothetical protein